MSDTKKIPGKYVCRECGGDNLTFSGSARWSVERQEWDTHNIGEDKPYCQDCEGSFSWAKFVTLGDTRSAPQLSRDYYDDLFVVIDDNGEPVTPYRTSLKRAKEDREDHGGEAEHYRIVKVAYKALPRDDGGLDEIVDDPRPQEESKELPSAMWP